MISVPFNDFHSAYSELKAELDDAYFRFMQSGWYVLGKEVSSFEEEYASFCEASYCVGVSNGLDALHFALRALEIGQGDEVIVPSNTYIATWLAVTQSGATIVSAEPCPGTYNIDPDDVERLITPKTRAILAVNLYGQPCDYDRLRALSEKYGVKLVIDNAQAQGSKYKGRTVGGIADIECHSFYPTKNLGAFGEAGAITTNDTRIADSVRLLRNYGSRVRYHNLVRGYNGRLDELQAGFLRVKLRHLTAWNSRRKAAAELYREKLAGIPGLVLPEIPEWADPVWHLYVIRTGARASLQETLNKNGVQTIIHYPIPPHLSEAYKQEWLGKKFPIAENLADEILSLPLHPHLTTAQISAVSSVIEQFFSKGAPAQ
jgi:dTDP-4-amino-4,6-dideoxygalactose transaminase